MPSKRCKCCHCRRQDYFCRRCASVTASPAPGDTAQQHAQRSIQLPSRPRLSLRKHAAPKVYPSAASFAPIATEVVISSNAPPTGIVHVAGSTAADLCLHFADGPPTLRGLSGDACCSDHALPRAGSTVNPTWLGIIPHPRARC